MIRITVTDQENNVWQKNVEVGATPDTGIACMVDDIVLGIWMRCEIKDYSWKFI